MTPREAGEEDLPSPRSSWRLWAVTFEQTPDQLSAYVSPCTLLVRGLWVLILYMLIIRMCPIPQVSKSVQGVEHFVNQVEFAKVAPGGPEAALLQEQRPRRSRWREFEDDVEDATSGFLARFASGRPGRSRAREAAALVTSDNATASNASAVAVTTPAPPQAQRHYDPLGDGNSDLEAVATLDDVAGFTTALVSALLPEHAYNGERDDQEKLMLLRVHRLLSSIVIIQRRVKATECAYENMRPYYPTCYEDLTEQSENKSSFLGFDYDPVLQGITARLPLDREQALSQVHALSRMKFWDRATREASVGFIFHNAPGHYTGYAQLQFKLSPYGQVLHDMDVEFLRLEPYNAAVQGYQLVALQVMAVVFVGLILFEVLYLASRQLHVRWTLAYLFRFWACVDIILLVVVISCGITWYNFITDPARVAKSEDSGVPEFDELAQLAIQFSNVTFLLSLMLLISVIRMVEYLTMIPEVGEMYRVLGKAVNDMGYFAIIFFTMFVGFSLSGHVLFGSQLGMFSSTTSTGSHLMLWFLALGGGHEDLFKQPGGLLFLVIFMIVVMVLLFNMLIGLVTNAFDAVAEEEKEHILVKPLNHKLADDLCDRLGIAPFHEDPYNINLEQRRSTKSSAGRTPTSAFGFQRDGGRTPQYGAPRYPRDDEGQLGDAEPQSADSEEYSSSYIQASPAPRMSSPPHARPGSGRQQPGVGFRDGRSPH